MSQCVRLLLGIGAGVAILVLLAALGGCGPASGPANYRVGPAPLVFPSPAPSPAGLAGNFPPFLIEVDNLTSRPMMLEVDAVWSQAPFRVTTNYSSFTRAAPTIAGPNGSAFFWGGATPLEVVAEGEPTSAPYQLYGPVRAVLGVDYTASSTGVRVRLP